MNSIEYNAIKAIKKFFNNVEKIREKFKEQDKKAVAEILSEAVREAKSQRLPIRNW